MEKLNRYLGATYPIVNLVKLLSVVYRKFIDFKRKTMIVLHKLTMFHSLLLFHIKSNRNNFNWIMNFEKKILYKKAPCKKGSDLRR